MNQFSAFCLGLLSVATASLLGSAAQAQSVFPTMEPTNLHIFEGVGYGNDTADTNWVNVLEPEQMGNLQCIAVGNTNQVRCYGEQDYNLTILPATAQLPGISEFKIDDKDVHFRFGHSDRIGAMLRTHPSESNTSAILELGIQLD
jgi:hypothetical protein